MKSVKNFYHEHLGEVFTAAKHQWEKYASFRLIRLIPDRKLEVLASESRKAPVKLMELSSLSEKRKKKNYSPS